MVDLYSCNNNDDKDNNNSRPYNDNNNDNNDNNKYGYYLWNHKQNLIFENSKIFTSIHSILYVAYSCIKQIILPL